MKYKFKQTYFKDSTGFFKKLFLCSVIFAKRTRQSISLLSRKEKIAASILILAMFSLSIAKYYTLWASKTTPVPSSGGAYSEIVLGELKYLNPLLATTEADKSADGLIFSGLLKFDKDGTPINDLAQSYEVSPDGLQYTFILKDNIYFHDDQKMIADDVVSTINLIKTPDFKSPLYDKWKEVEARSEGDNKVVFTLPKPYGPFLFNCDVGILPSYLSADDFAKKVVGTGPYKFKKSNADKSSKNISELTLVRNDQYYAEIPKILEIEMHIYSDKDKAKHDFESGKFDAIAGLAASREDSKDYSFETSRRLSLIANLRKDKLKDKAFREKIFKGGKFESKTEVSLSTLDNEITREKAEELKVTLGDRNVDLTINYLSPMSMRESLKNKDYELLLYGFDLGYDRDPYNFWHSSQVGNLNFSGFSDKNADVILESARLNSDFAQRNAKYDEFFAIVQNESLAAFYDPLRYDFEVSTRIKGVEVFNGKDASVRFMNVSDWYTKEKRVKKDG